MNLPSHFKKDYGPLPQVVWEGRLNHAAVHEVRVVLAEHETMLNTIDLVVEVVRKDAMGGRSFVPTEHEAVKAAALRIALLHLLQNQQAPQR